MTIADQHAQRDWSRPFDDPITLPDGRTLRTLHDAGHYATALPIVQERLEWQTAAEMLMLAAQGQRRDRRAAGVACGQAVPALPPARSRSD